MWLPRLGMTVCIIRVACTARCVQRKTSVSRLHQNQFTFVLVSNYGIPKLSGNPFLKGFIRSEKETEIIYSTRE